MYKSVNNSLILYVPHHYSNTSFEMLGLW